jgi:hypothetical protein
MPTMHRPRRLASLVVVGVLAFGRPASAEPKATAPDSVDQSLCALIESSAAASRLPTDFFTRLIFRESALRTAAISPAGAEGVAQFMPGTAAERGLANPFDPETAIPEAARYLAELSRRFGNLGLAAAAYNAGSARVAEWLAGRSEMPLETRAYVLAITARSIEDWAKPALDNPSSGDPANPPGCLSTIARLRRGTTPQTVGQTLFAPWGVQLAGNFSKAVALASFERAREKYRAIIGAAEPFVLTSRLGGRGASPFFRVRLPAATQIEAQRLCGRLHAAGGDCVVLRS